MSTKLCVVGGGAFGSAVAHRLTKSSMNFNVMMYVLEPHVAEGIRANSVNPMIVPQVGEHRFLSNLSVTLDLAEATKGASMIFYAIPGKFSTSFLTKNAHHFAGVPFVNCSKGMVVVEGMISTMKAIAVSSGIKPEMYACISGPTFAKSMFGDEKILMSVAADADTVGIEVETILSNKSIGMSVYKSNDVVGQELCGALKNVVAIAAGLCSRAGPSSQPGVIAVLWNDVAAVIKAMDGGSGVHMNPPMFGDLIASCASSSRNYTFGERVACGEMSALEVIADMPSVEGYNSLPLLIRFCETRTDLTAETARFQAVHDACEGRISAQELVQMII